MQKLPETPDSKRGCACAKNGTSRQKEPLLSFSAVTSGVATPKSFLQLVEGAMSPSLDDALANLSTSRRRLFYQRPPTKSTK